QHKVGDPELARSGEGLCDPSAEGIDVLKCPVFRFGPVIGEAGPPRRARSNVAAEMSKQVPRAGAILAAVTAWEVEPPPYLAPDLDEEVGRRYPLELHSIVQEPAAEERLVRQWRILEIPRMLMDLVQVADAGQEAPAFQRKSLAQSEG